MLYEFKCQQCGTRQPFSGRYAASKAGWAIAEVWTVNGVKYLVTCSTCIPAWVRTAQHELSQPKGKQGA